MATIGATFAADFSSIERGIGSVNVKFKDLIVTAQSAQKAVDKMGDAFSGRALITNATAAVKAVTDLGGATKLTASEQAKLNTTLTEAIAKYTALGQQAPADMVALAQATQTAADATARHSESFNTLVASYVTGLATFEGAKRVLEGIGEFLTSSLEAYGQAEAAQKRVTVALQAQGNATPRVIEQYKALAETFATTTTFSDELVTQMEALFIQVGNVGPQDMRAALSAATDLAEGLGIDLQTAVEAVAKASAGSTTALHKMAPSLDEAAIKGGNLADVAREIEKHFGGQASAALDTYAGRVKQLGNEWDQVKEAIGGALANDSLLQATLRVTADALGNAKGKADGFKVSTTLMSEAQLADNPLLANAIGLLYRYADASNTAAAADRKRKAAQVDIDLPDDTKGAGVPSTFVGDLAAARTAMNAFTADQRANIKAGIELHASIDDIAKALNLSKSAVQLYDDSLKKATESAKKAAEAQKKAKEELQHWSEAVDEVEANMHKLFDEAQAEQAKKNAEAVKEFTAAINEMSGQTGLDKALFDLDALNAAMAQGGATAEATKKVYDEVGAAINAILSGGAKLTGTLEEQTAQWDRLTQAAADFSALHPIEPLKEDLPVVIKETKDWERDLGNLAQAFSQLSQISDGSFGSVAKAIGETIAALNLAKKSTDGIHDSWNKVSDAFTNGAGFKKGVEGFTEIATAALGVVAAMDAATSSASRAQNVIGGFVTGAQAGAAVSGGNPYVTIIGGIVGAIIGWVRKLGKEVSSVMYEFGEHISKDLAKGIEDQAKAEFGGNRQAAKIFNLDNIISQGGGITAKNFDVLTDRLHDVYSMIETGAFTADQAQSVLDKNFQSFVDFLGGRVSPALKNIIKLNDDFGTHSKAIAQYVDAQANTALDSLSKVVSQRQSALDALNNAKSPEDIKKAQAQLGALPLTKNSGAAFGGALFGIFERLQKDGVSVTDTLKQIDPIIKSLDKQFAAAGIVGGAAFNKIKSLASIATDEIAGPSFEAIHNYSAALDALNNANILDQETFTGLTDQVTATYNAAVDALVKEGKDGSQALGMVAPDLQKIWELQQDFGYAVDDATQKLLDQAITAGEVGEKHRSIQQQELDLQQKQLDVLTAMATAFGVTLPDAAQTGANGIVNALNGAKTNGVDPLANAIKNIPSNIPVTVDYKTNQLPGENDYQQGPDSHPYKHGGPVYASRGMFIGGPKGADIVPAWLAPGEFVMNRAATSRIGAGTLDGWNRGGSPGPAGPTIDYDRLAAAVLRGVGGALNQKGLSTLGSSGGRRDALDKHVWPQMADAIVRLGGIRRQTRTSLGVAD